MGLRTGMRESHNNSQLWQLQKRDFDWNEPHTKANTLQTRTPTHSQKAQGNSIGKAWY